MAGTVVRGMGIRVGVAPGTDVRDGAAEVGTTVEALLDVDLSAAIVGSTVLPPAVNFTAAATEAFMARRPAVDSAAEAGSMVAAGSTAEAGSTVEAEAMVAGIANRFCS